MHTVFKYKPNLMEVNAADLIYNGHINKEQINNVKKMAILYLGAEGLVV